MEYFFNRDGVQEKVSEERWKWRAIYKDGSELMQFGRDGVFHQIGEVDQKNIKEFVVYNVDLQKKITMVFPSRAKIIYKYKHYIFNEGSKAEYRAMIYEVGYKLDGRYHYNFILPDDNIVQSNSENF